MKNILFIICTFLSLQLIAQTNTGASSFPLKESPKGIYLLLSDKAISKNTDFTDVKITRSVNGLKSKELGKPAMAANMEEFEKIIGKDALLDIASLFKLENKERAFNYVQEHPSVADYGLLALNLDLGVALGAFYLDKDLTGIKPGDKITYSVTFYGRENYTVTSTHIFGQKPQIEKPKLSSKLITDSLIELKWKVSKRNSPEIFFGDIYVKEGHPAEFKKAGITFANNEETGDSVQLKWSQKTKKGFQYSIFVTPATQAMLQGTASDTLTIISISELSIPQPQNLQSKDTSHGIMLTWQNPTELTTQKAWLLQRTFSQDDEYINIATLDVRSPSYTDMEVMPGEYYYYRIKTITLNHDTIGPSSHTSTRHLSLFSSPLSPDGVFAKSIKEGVQVNWKKVKLPDVAGYYVYRSHSENNRFDLISGLIRDTVFVDNETLYGRNRYTYGVRAYTTSEMMGEMGISNLYVPENVVKPAAPTGAIYYTQPGSVHLAWDDMQWNDNAVSGYRIYKKTGTLPTTLDLNNPIKMGFALAGTSERNEFDDKIFGSGIIHYAITSYDQYGVESEIGQILTIETTSVPLAVPNNFNVRKTSSGVVIDWDLPANSQNATYTIYKRSATEKIMVKVATVQANKLSYTDANVKANTVYYYSISATINNETSPMSEEKYVRY